MEIHLPAKNTGVTRPGPNSHEPGPGHQAEGLTCTGMVQLSCSGVLGRGLAKATPAWASDFDLLFLRFFRALL